MPRVDSNSFTPVSFIVGTSEASFERSRPMIASPRSCLDFT